MMRSIIFVAALSLAACGSVQAEDEMADLKEQAVNASPLVREVAASNTFFFCNDHPEPDRYHALCEACEVNLFPDKDLPFRADPDTDAPIVGVKGWATHYYHEYKPWGDDPKPRISATGERATKKFETKELTVEAVQTLFEDANMWCRARRKGEFLILKDEIESFIEGLPE
ncbi:MAG: hypothetical protein AAGB16_10395 [Pseudomonadota bacterium]